MKIGTVGYGTGGRHFHAPFIKAADGVELVGIVARAPATVARVQADYPGLPSHASLTDMLAAGVDAVTITTLPQTRLELEQATCHTGRRHHRAAGSGRRPAKRDREARGQAVTHRGGGTRRPLSEISERPVPRP